MPNHVDQDLVVTGSPTILKEFAEFAVEGEDLLSANKFIPYPKEYEGTAGFNAGGYEWCLANWGTKWGIYRAELKTQKLTGKQGRIKYNCQSAWSPAIPVIEAMSKKFPTLKFELKYYEQGMQFQGHFIVQNGNVLKNEERSYSGRRGG